MADYAITGLMSNVKDVARQYMFEFEVSWGAGNFGKSKFYVDSTSLPGVTNDELALNWQGMVYKVGTTNTYDSWEVTFKLDTASDLRKAFLDWNKKIYDAEEGKHGAAPDDYMADQTVKLLSHTDLSPIQEITLVSAWPSAVGEVSLDYGSKEMASFSVTFTYQYFTVA